MTVNQFSTQAEASLDIQRQIEANFGTADVFDELRFQVLPCPDENEGKTLTCIAAFPRNEGATSDKLMIALYG